ncbi:unnamed protein product, partial [Schistosoma turkestanicum]
VQQSNCYYQLLDKTPNIPVNYRTEDGVVYLTPNWTRNPNNNNTTTTSTTTSTITHQRPLLSAHLQTATINNSSTIQQYIQSHESGQLYYLFFRVSCYEDDFRRPPSSSTAAEAMESMSSINLSTGQQQSANMPTMGNSSYPTSSFTNNNNNRDQNQTWLSVNPTLIDANNNNNHRKYKLVFQHSFYVYISIAKYPF